MHLANSIVVLRRFSPADGPGVQRLAGDPAVADTTLAIPHPYPDGAAEAWIATHEAQFADGTGAIFAIAAPEDGAVLGAIGVRIDPAHRHGEIGYWIGKPFWGRGYATAALRLFVECCFAQLDLHRVYAHHLVRNPASGLVMQKAGMRFEGRLREHICKAGRFEDIAFYGLLKGDHV
jgi:RimJ/RimL family protein N-acetyltransferase